MFSGHDATHLDLSAKLTAQLLSSSDSHQEVTTNGDVEFAKAEQFELRLTGTAQQYEECLQMIIEEAWDNVNDQLDAWQQLYLLACVRMWFISYWYPNEFTSSDELWPVLRAEMKADPRQATKQVQVLARMRPHDLLPRHHHQTRTEGPCRTRGPLFFANAV